MRLDREHIPASLGKGENSSEVCWQESLTIGHRDLGVIRWGFREPSAAGQSKRKSDRYHRQKG